MKKRLITLLIAFVMMFTLIVPAVAAEPSASAKPEVITSGGGMDFYSITVNYTDEILVDYVKGKYDGEKAYLFKGEDGQEVKADKVVLRAGVTKELDSIGYDRSDPADTSNFYQLEAPSEGIYANAHYSNFPYDYAYITHIQDGAIIKSKTAFSFYGIFAPYDEGAPYANKNPNVVYDDDGYALDKETDKDGKNYRIDINNYRIDDKGLWYDDAGNRVELFYQVPSFNYVGVGSKGTDAKFNREISNQFASISYAERFDSNGMVKDVSDMIVYYYISKEDYLAFLEANKNASSTDPAQLPLKKAAYSEEEARANGTELVETVTAGRATNKLDQLKRGTKFTAPYFYVACNLKTYRVVQQSTYVDDSGKVVEDKSKKMTKDMYLSEDTLFSEDYIARDASGNLIISTPTQGNPKLNVEIESITIEIDAVGQQLYTDAASDPQNKNEITVSINDFPQNIALKEAALADEWISQKTFDSYQSRVLATVNSKTTATSAVWSESDIKDSSYKSTVTSIDLGLSKEELNALPYTATLYLSFSIETQQPDEACNKSYIKLDADSGKTTLYPQNANIWTRPSEPDTRDEESGLDPIVLAMIIAGGVVVVAAVAVAVVLVLKKKKK